MAVDGTFGPALKAARRHFKWNQAELAHHLGMSPRSIGRWEAGDGPPDLHWHAAIAEWARTLEPSLGEPILHGLGIPVVAAPTREAVLANARRAVDAAVHAMAEELDVGPRSLRRGIDRVLGVSEAAGLGLTDTRQLLLPTGEKRAR